jgi:hypothetical protein
MPPAAAGVEIVAAALGKRVGVVGAAAIAIERIGAGELHTHG